MCFRVLLVRHSTRTQFLHASAITADEHQQSVNTCFMQIDGSCSSPGVAGCTAARQALGHLSTHIFSASLRGAFCDTYTFYETGQDCKFASAKNITSLILFSVMNSAMNGSGPITQLSRCWAVELVFLQPLSQYCEDQPFGWRAAAVGCGCSEKKTVTNTWLLWCDMHVVFLVSILAQVLIMVADPCSCFTHSSQFFSFSRCFFSVDPKQSLRGGVGMPPPASPSLDDHHKSESKFVFFPGWRDCWRSGSQSCGV